MREWIVPDNDIGVDGAYFGYQEILRCKDCKKFVKEEDQTYCMDMFGQCDENGFCAWAERKEECGHQ